MKKRKAGKWVILALAVAALAGGYLMRSDETQSYAQTTVTTGDISTSFSFTGSVVAPRSQTIMASAPGKVKELCVAANEQVKEGDRLMKLSTGETLRADIDGEIVRLDVSEGDVVAAGDVLVSIVDGSRLEAQVSVDEYDVGAVESGREVQVTVNALGETVVGAISRFDKEATVATGKTMAAYTAHIAFEAPEKTLPGMQVEVQMIDETAENTLLLKMDALQFDTQNRAYVLTKNADGEYVETHVETGISDGSNVQILSGLTAGQTVYYESFDLMEMMMAMRGGR